VPKRKERNGDDRSVREKITKEEKYKRKRREKEYARDSRVSVRILVTTRWIIQKLSVQAVTHWYSVSFSNITESFVPCNTIHFVIQWSIWILSEFGYRRIVWILSEMVELRGTKGN
jgi:hypothetical protein